MKNFEDVDELMSSLDREQFLRDAGMARNSHISGGTQSAGGGRNRGASSGSSLEWGERSTPSPGKAPEIPGKSMYAQVWASSLCSGLPIFV